MMSKPIKLIACRALAHIFDTLVGPDVERVFLPVNLHLNPDRLRERLIEEIRKIEEAGSDIVLGYGLCGRALEGVYSNKSRLILPRVDDCVGAILGSKTRHKAILAENTGCFFLEPAWIGTEVDVFAQCLKGLDRIPEEYRDEIVDMALRHYSKLALIDHGPQDNPLVINTCKKLAETYNLEFAQYLSDLNLLQDLVDGRWHPDRFVINEPDQKIPFF